MLLLRPSEAFYDEADYLALGRSVAAGEGLLHAGGPTAFRPPGQPLWLGGLFALFGDHPTVALVAQALLAFALPVAVHGIAVRLGASRVQARLSAAAVALHPALAYASGTFYPVALTTTALTVGIWLALELLEHGGAARACSAGALLGVAAAATPYFAPLPLVIAGLAMARRRFGAGVLVAVVGLAPTAAWVARNHAELGAWTLATNGGYNLALGANDLATPRSGNWIEPPALPPEVSGELEKDRAYRAEAVAWIDAHRAQYAGLVAARAVAVLDSVGNPRTPGLHDSLAAQLAGLALLPWVLLGVLGLALSRRTAAAWLVGAALGLVVVSSSLTIVKPRFRFPVDPALAPFALIAAARLRSALGARRAVGGPDYAAARRPAK